MKEVFVSHSSHNREIAEDLVKVLEEQDISCWISYRDMIGGIPYAQQLRQSIKESKVLLLLASEAINQSEQILNEVEAAVEFKKIILPFKIDDADYNENYMYYLKKNHWIEAQPSPADHYVELIKSVKYLLSMPDENIDTVNDQYLIALTEKNKRELINKTAEKRLSFGLSIEDDAKCADKHHYYDYIRRMDMIDKNTGTYTSYRWIKITNVSDTNTTFIYHKECGENKSNFSDIKLKAKTFNCDNPQRLIVESLTEVQPNFVQVVKIHFNKPLEPNESIEIFYRLEWAGEAKAYYSGELSDSISFTRYIKGVGRLEFGIMENLPLFGFELIGIRNNYEEKDTNLAPIMIKCEEIKELTPLYGKGYAGAYFVVDNVEDNISYRLLYKEGKADTIEDDEEDDFI